MSEICYWLVDPVKNDIQPRHSPYCCLGQLFLFETWTDFLLMLLFSCLLSSTSLGLFLFAGMFSAMFSTYMIFHWLYNITSWHVIASWLGTVLRRPIWWFVLDALPQLHYIFLISLYGRHHDYVLLSYRLGCHGYVSL